LTLSLVFMPGIYFKRISRYFSLLKPIWQKEVL